jgi:hypothetical protein
MVPCIGHEIAAARTTTVDKEASLIGLTTRRHRRRRRAQERLDGGQRTKLRLQRCGHSVDADARPSARGWAKRM